MIDTKSEIDPREWLAAIVDSSSDAIVSKNLNGVITSWNAGAERIFGYSSDEMIGQPILKIIPANRQDEESYLLAQVGSGERVSNYNTVRVHKSGRLIQVSLTVSPIRAPGGSIVGVSKIARDITEWKTIQDTQSLLLLELNHRSKNLLTVVDAIVRQSAKTTVPSELVARISGRLRALSINQDLLIERNWHGAELSRLISAQMAPLLDDFRSRIQITGPPTFVSPPVAQVLSMAIYELAANALKFGSLSADGGQVHISWSSSGENGDREFRICWQESGGPQPSQFGQKGLGSIITETLIARSLHGKAKVTYPSGGLVWELIVPEPALLESSNSTNF